MEDNLANVLSLLDRGGPNTRLLDLGCDDGARTVTFAGAIGTSNVHGVEVVSARAELASRRGVDVHVGDLADPLPYADASFDVVCSNQVIEHLSDTDRFLGEVARVLAPGGYAVTSTENLASWHNIAALLAGWQPFSLTNVTRRAGGLGNPLAVHRDSEGHLPSWEHVRVFAYRGLIELHKLHGLAVERVLAAGYYPLPSRVARWDKRHSAFLTIRARREPAS
jgi:SAM-dependent methyltransferase